VIIDRSGIVDSGFKDVQRDAMSAGRWDAPSPRGATVLLGGDPICRAVRGAMVAPSPPRPTVGLLDFRMENYGAKCEGLMSDLEFVSSAGRRERFLERSHPTGWRPTRLVCSGTLAGGDPPLSPELSRLPDVARAALAGFFAGDRLQPVLGEIADAALDLAAPTTAVRGCPDPLFALELHHGPTAAFKDFGARFLAESLAAPGRPARSLTILVATSATPEAQWRGLPQAAVASA